MKFHLLYLYFTWMNIFMLHLGIPSCLVSTIIMYTSVHYILRWSWALNVPDTHRQVILMRRNNVCWRPVSYVNGTCLAHGWIATVYFLVESNGQVRIRVIHKKRGKEDVVSMLTQLCTASCKEHQGCGSKSYMDQKWSFARYAKGEGNMSHGGPKVSSDQIHACEHLIVEKS